MEQAQQSMVVEATAPPSTRGGFSSNSANLWEAAVRQLTALLNPNKGGVDELAKAQQGADAALVAVQQGNDPLGADRDDETAKMLSSLVRAQKQLADQVGLLGC